MTTKRVMFSFPKSKSEKPIVWHLVKEYDLVINIFRAKVTPEEFGYLVIDVSGSEENIKRGMEFVRSQDVDVNEERANLVFAVEIALPNEDGALKPGMPADAVWR